MSVPTSPPTHLLQRLGRSGDQTTWCGVAERECLRVTTLRRYTTCRECGRLYDEAMTAVNDPTTTTEE